MANTDWSQNGQRKQNSGPFSTIASISNTEDLLWTSHCVGLYTEHDNEWDLYVILRYVHSNEVDMTHI